VHQQWVYTDDEKGKNTTFSQAMAYHNQDVRQVPPTTFVNENGQIIVKTDDDKDDTFVIKEQNVQQFLAILGNWANRGLDKNNNIVIGEHYGMNINRLKYKERMSYPVGDDEIDKSFEFGYKNGYEKGLFSISTLLFNMGGSDERNKRNGYNRGLFIGRRHNKEIK